MTNKKIISFIVCLGFVIPTLCQEYNFKEGQRVILSEDGVNNMEFMIYTPSYKAKPIYKKLDEVKNESPEQLMSSIISANSQEWVDYNTFGGSESSSKKTDEYFNSIKKQDAENTYLDLQSKLSFSNNGIQYVIVKYYIHKEGIPEMPGAYVFRKVGNQWYRTSTSYTTDLAIVISQISNEYMMEMLLGKETDIEELNQVIRNTKEDSKVNIGKLVSSLNQIMTSDENLYSKIKDAKAW